MRVATLFRGAVTIGLVSLAVFASIWTAPPAFTPVDFDMDLTMARYRRAVEGFRVEPVQHHPAMMKVFDAGGGPPAVIVLPAVPARQGCVLRFKIKFHAMDQAVNLTINGRRAITMRPTTLDRAQKWSLWLPSGQLSGERNILELRHRGTPHQTEFEQIRIINYRSALSKLHHAYLVFSGPPEGWRGVLAWLVMLIQWTGVCGLVAILWSAGDSRRPFVPWFTAAHWGVAAGSCAWLFLLSGQAPYQLVFPGARFWTTAATAVGALLCSTIVAWPSESAAPPRQRLEWAVARLRGLAADLAGRVPAVVVGGRWGIRMISRIGVPVLLALVVIYGVLLRYGEWFGQLDKAWNFLGTTNDVVLIMDAAARVFKTGTFTQFDGSYARVTGLAGYGLGVLAMGVGGVYPGFAWLKEGFLVIGAALPLAGFAAIKAACGSAIGGLGVAALLAGEPILIQESLTIYHDVPATLCAGLTLYWLARVLREERVRPRLATALGLSSGITILAKMSHACLVAVILASAVFRRWTLARWKNIGVALVVTALVLGIWMGRNARMLGAPILSSQSGFVFACSTGQPVLRPPGVEISTVGLEQHLNHWYVQQAMTWIVAHPREYLADAVRRVRAFWLEGPSPWIQSLRWALLASLVILVAWERRLILPMVPTWLYLTLYSITFGFTWAALPTYYPPFLFLCIVACAPLFVGTFGRAWQFIRWLGHTLGIPGALIKAAAVLVCLEIGLPFLQAPWQEFSEGWRRSRQDHAYLAWVGTVLPDEAIVLQTDRGDPWETHQATRRPVVFNVLNGIPWFVYKIPYGIREYHRDWQYASMSITSFRPGIARGSGPVDALAALTPQDLKTVSDVGGVRGLLALWRRHGRQLFVLDRDAVFLAEQFLPSNAYALRGDELALKPYRAWPHDPSRAVYRLVERDDPRLGAFGESTEQSVTWTTVPCLHRESMTVWFTGAFGPDPGMAQLAVNGVQALSFRLSPMGNAAWAENGYRLEYWQRHAWTAGGAGVRWSIGTFILTVPADVIQVGHPLTLSVSPVLVTNDPESWFGLVDRPGIGPPISGRSPTQQLEGLGAVQRASVILPRVLDEHGQPTTIWAAGAQMEQG